MYDDNPTLVASWKQRTQCKRTTWVYLFRHGWWRLYGYTFTRDSRTRVKIHAANFVGTRIVHYGVPSRFTEPSLRGLTGKTRLISIVFFWGFFFFVFQKLPIILYQQPFLSPIRRRYSLQQYLLRPPHRHNIYIQVPFAAYPMPRSISRTLIMNPPE